MRIVKWASQLLLGIIVASTLSTFISFALGMIFLSLLLLLLLFRRLTEEVFRSHLSVLLPDNHFRHFLRDPILLSWLLRPARWTQKYLLSTLSPSAPSPSPSVISTRSLQGLIHSLVWSTYTLLLVSLIKGRWYRLFETTFLNFKKSLRKDRSNLIFLLHFHPDFTVFCKYAVDFSFPIFLMYIISHEFQRKGMRKKPHFTLLHLTEIPASSFWSVPFILHLSDEGGRVSSEICDTSFVLRVF